MTCRVVADLSLRGGVYREAHRTPKSFSLVSGGVWGTHHNQGEPEGENLRDNAVLNQTNGQPSWVEKYRADAVLRRNADCGNQARLERQG